MIPLAIEAVGAFASNGGDAPAVMGSILSKVQIFGDLDLASPVGEPLGGGVTPLARGVKGLYRLAAMALVVLTECATDSPQVAAPVIALLPSRDDLDGDPAEVLDAVLSQDAALPFDRRLTHLVAAGRDGIGRALAIAGRMLAGRKHASCYLVAADSLIHGSRLRRLVDRGAIIHEGNPDGVVPGEAAVAVRLTLANRGRPLAVIAAIAESEEPAARPEDDGETPLTGQGYTTAVREALKPAGGSSLIAGLVVDRAGPQLRLEEIALACQRQPLAGINPEATFLPTLSVGETGAAAGLLSLATTAFFIHKGIIEGVAACMFTGENEWRGAAIVAPPGGKLARGHG